MKGKRASSRRPTPILGGGGLVATAGIDGGIRLAVVHRPRYDDWSFPKAKLRDGETPQLAALRAMQDETGLQGELGAELAQTRYLDHRGRPKVVRWFMVRHTSGNFAPVEDGGVDQLRWVRPQEALILLTHAHDRRLLLRSLTALRVGMEQRSASGLAV